MKQRIAVIGAGAIGGVTAAWMAKAGEDVTLVCKHEEIAEAASGKGLHVTGRRGEAWVRMKAVKEIEYTDGVFDLCLIATKAYDMPEAARKMLPRLKEDALVVSMQNGICTDDLAAEVGRGRTVGCVIGWGATMHGPAEVEMTSGGGFVIGMLDGRSSQRIQALKAALETVAPTRISEDIYGELYSKLIVNACITSLGAVCGLRLGEMMARRDARRIFLAVIGEAVAVAEKLDLRVPPYGGLDYFRLMRGSGPLDRLRRHLTIRLVGLRYARLKSSSLQSLEQGKPTEVDAFNGYIASRGREAEVPCPVCERLVVMVKEIERGKREITVNNLQDPVFAALRD